MIYIFFIKGSDSTYGCHMVSVAIVLSYGNIKAAIDTM